ncbi:hypothetical protein DSO57_1018413 [Entomophthora muscae]|uniref:Uncharacterized protein n=1 Tax=Entomophthora muscae TaxID=34485 RepID=A0ACC2TF11_9FUNG|nr:hypothetical protein DSO57_1018413 [Entomophthora muscae]
MVAMAPVLSGLTIFPLETQAQGKDFNPDPEPLQAAGLKDQGAAHVFLGSSPRKLKPIIIVQKMKLAKSKESLHQMEE